MKHATNNNRFRSKLHAMQKSIPVYACKECRTKHDAPKHARCVMCKHITDPMTRLNGGKLNKNCPNCARPGLKNERVKPFSCIRCGKTEFIYFHSTGEFEYFAQLGLLQDRGKITGLELQKPFIFEIGGDVMFKYLADFVFEQIEPDGSSVRRVLDYKGSDQHTDGVFNLKRRIVEKVFNLKIETVR